MAFFCLKKNRQCSKRCLVWFWPQLTFLHGQRNHRKVPRIAFLFWPGLSPPGSGRTLGCTCKRTSSRAHSSAPGRRAPAVGGSLPASCGQRASLTDTWNHEIILLVCTFQPSWALILHRKNKSSLCRAESQLEVFSGLVGVEGWILKRVGEEAVHQGAEGYAIFPTGGKVLDVHPLFQSRFMSNTRSRELRCKSRRFYPHTGTSVYMSETRERQYFHFLAAPAGTGAVLEEQTVTPRLLSLRLCSRVENCSPVRRAVVSETESLVLVLSSFQVASFCNVWLVWSCIYLQIWHPQITDLTPRVESFVFTLDILCFNDLDLKCIVGTNVKKEKTSSPRGQYTW